MVFLRTKEVAEELQVTTREVRYLCTRGRIKAAKIGRDWVISRKALETYIQERNGEK